MQPLLRRSRRLAALAALVAATLVTTTGLATPAQAGLQLTAGPEVEAPCPPVDPKWTLDATGPQYLIGTDAPFAVSSSFGPHWSVVAVLGRQYEADITLYPGKANLCNALATSTGLGLNWVAVDDLRSSDTHYVGAALTNLTDKWWSGYAAQFVIGSQTLSTVNPSTDQAVGRPDGWLVDVKGVQLDKGNTYVVSGDAGISRIYLLTSDDDDPGTWSRTPTTATLIASREYPDDPIEGLVRVDREAAYGLLFVPAYLDPALDQRGHVRIQTIPDCGPRGCGIPKP